MNIKVVLPNLPSVLLGLGEYDRKILDFENVFIENHKTKDLPYSTIRLPSKFWKSSKDVIPIEFNYYNRNIDDEKRLFIPFGIHPEARLKGLDRQNVIETKNDSIRIFCAGNLSYPDYNTQTIPSRFSMLNRATAIETIKRYFPESTSFAPLQILADDFKASICLIDQAKCGLNMESYFRALESSTFIFCPPGVNLPHCHNIYEGMSRGCIPILEYPHLLRPKLTPNVNCLSFEGSTGLIDTLKYALTLKKDVIKDLKSNTTSYFNTFCNINYLTSINKDTSISSLCLLNENDSFPI
jgi:hypothetical protein